MSPLASSPSPLSFRLRNILAAACLLLASSLVAQSPAAASSPAPRVRFELPASPFDYTAPPPPRRASFPGCGPAVPRQRPTSQRLWSLRANRLRGERRDDRATLGRVLFYDDLLSRDRSRSCATCHRQELAFTDGRAHGRGVGGARTARSSMSTVNVAYARGPLFWDGRAKSLEEVVVAPIENAHELGLPLEQLVVRLEREPGYAALFRRAFGDDEVTIGRIGDALATFVGAIASFGSRYDAGLEAVGGEYEKPFPNFSDAENRGKAVFFGEGDRRNKSCAECHVQSFSGCSGQTIHYYPTILQGDSLRNNGLDAGARGDDIGYGAVSGAPADRGRFRAPSLRNVALTAPYMHDGRLRTLEDVVDFYAAQVRPHPQLDPLLSGKESRYRPRSKVDALPTAVPDAPVLVGPSPGMPMTAQQRRDLVAFLHTLTDESLLTDPRFSDPFVR